MSNPTTPFSWQMPTATDLVTSLPADFEVFGQAVATSMADLLGGTTGQVLAKTSATDMDFTWTTPQVGDITGVTAGVGITGGGTSGTVTVTNDMATTITTAGDLIYGTGSGTYTRRGIGSTGNVLTVSGGVPVWSAPAANSFVGVSLVKSAVQAVANATDTLITWNTEDFDTSAFHDPTTNTDRITIPAGKAGYYLIEARVSFAANATGIRSVSVKKNGATIVVGADLNNQGSSASSVLIHSRVISAAVADYFNLNAYQTSGGSLNTDNTAGYTFFTMTYLGA
jgi:hypothetical protein